MQQVPNYNSTTIGVRSCWKNHSILSIVGRWMQGWSESCTIERLMQRTHFMLWLLVMFVAMTAFPKLFSTLAPYDDEGYCMMTMQTYQQGARLYAETHTQYGPAYYYLTTPIHQWLGLPLTQTAVRCKTLAFWMMASLLSYLLARRIGVSSFGAAVIAGFVGLNIDKLALEPSHPQEGILVATLIVAFLVCGGVGLRFAVPQRSTARLLENRTMGLNWLLAGLLVGLIGMTKVNAGMLVAIPLLIVAADSWRHVPWLRFGLAALACCPALLVTWMGRSEWYSMAWSLWVGLCAFIFVGLGQRSRQDGLRILPLGLVIVGASISVVAIALRAAFEGITCEDLWYGLIEQHRDFSDDFFIPTPKTIGSVLGLIACLALIATKSPIRHMTSVIVSLLLVVLSIWWSSLESLEHGLIARGAGPFLAWFVPGFAAFTQAANEEDRRLRLFVILSPLLAFPVPGTQIEMGTTLGLVLVSGYVFRWAASTTYPSQRIDRLVRYRYAFGLAMMVCLVLPWIRYGLNKPLDLPGSSWMRLPMDRVEIERSVANAIASSEAEHVIFEGHNNNRFFFWTDRRPLTTASPTFWPRMLNDRERLRIETALQRPGKFCVVRVPNYEAYYDDRTQVIQHYLRADWNKQIEISDWEIGVIEVK